MPSAVLLLPLVSSENGAQPGSSVIAAVDIAKEGAETVSRVLCAEGVGVKRLILGGCISCQQHYERAHHYHWPCCMNRYCRQVHQHQWLCCYDR